MDGSVLAGVLRFRCGACQLALTGDDLEAARLEAEVQPSDEELSRESAIDWLIMADVDDQLLGADTP
ncbi:hypothetical protein [Nocardia carnea]|uniref:hypothetical protein n=1 Tax=Nocardia carnea TaxID=37328 RepID=UPI002453C531|nr:hypothetical protein [Nocardia carnea]